MGEPHLSSHHRRTMQQILDHPVSHNIEWRDVLSLLSAIGTVDERHDSKIRFGVVAATETIEIPVSNTSAVWASSIRATSVVNLLDLGRLLLTGPGVAVAGSIYARRVRAHLERTAHSRHRHPVTVELSAQPREVAGIGAAALVVQASIAPGHTPGQAG